MVWEQGYAQFSCCCLHCCDINVFDLPQLWVEPAMLSIGVSMGFTLLLACLVSFL